MTPRGIRNNNPLNIRKGNNWKGERHPQTDKQFEEFISMEMGLRAAFVLLRNYMCCQPPCNTIEKILLRWAPPSENATQRYIDIVSRYAAIPARQVIKFSDVQIMCAVVKAMAFVECGVWLEDSLIRSAYEIV